MHITYDFDHVFYPGADMVLNLQTLRAMCELSIQVNLMYLHRMKQLGRAVPSLYRSGVVYARDDLWRPIPKLYRVGKSDCKNLAPALIAEERFQGVFSVPSFRWVENADGTIDWHILRRLGAEFEDPSRVLGMGDDEVAKFYAESAQAA